MPEKLLTPRKPRKMHPNSRIIIPPADPSGRGFGENKKRDLFNGKALK
jgi:hypothetical protein